MLYSFIFIIFYCCIWYFLLSKFCKFVFCFVKIFPSHHSWVMSENQPFCLNHLLFADFAVNVWLISHTDWYISILTLLNQKEHTSRRMWHYQTQRSLFKKNYISVYRKTIKVELAQTEQAWKCPSSKAWWCIGCIIDCGRQRSWRYQINKVQ